MNFYTDVQCLGSKIKNHLPVLVEFGSICSSAVIEHLQFSCGASVWFSRWQHWNGFVMSR